MSATTLQIPGLGWILPNEQGSGAGLLDAAARLLGQPAPNTALSGFSAKPYLSSVKGYLDPAGSFCLAAAALALRSAGIVADGTLRERSGICSLTRYGATLSAYRFHEQLQQKGPRLASPLVFPHGYANTAGNLAAIEFGFGGPHMVFYGDQDLREALAFAAARLADGTAREMLVTAYESADPEVLPDGRTVLHGAVAFVLVANGSQTPLLQVEMPDAMRLPRPQTGKGMVADCLELLRQLAACGSR